MGNGWLCGWLLGAFAIYASDATGSEEDRECVVPLSLQGLWRRTDTGSNLAFNGTGVTILNKDGSEIDLACDVTADFKYVFSDKSDVTNPHGVRYYCWKLVRSTAMSWLLYSLEEKGGLLRNQSEPVPSVNEVCSTNDDRVLPTMLFRWPNKKAQDLDVTRIASSERQCPRQLLASFQYVKDETGCMDAETELDFCQDRIVARVNYKTCDARILFSDKGALSCTASFGYSGATYAMLVNLDPSVNGLDTHRFVCLKLTSNDSEFTATVYPGDCANTANTHELSLFIAKTCAPMSDGGSKLMWIIIGVVVGVNVVALSAIFFCIYRKVKAERKKQSVSRYVAATEEESAFNDEGGRVDKGNKRSIPAILPPLEEEEEKNTSEKSNDMSNGHAKKDTSVTVTHM